MLVSTPDSQQLLEELRTLLLEEDRVAWEQVRERLAALEEIAARDDFALKLEPHLETYLARLQKEFPELFGKHLGTAIKVQIRESQNEIIDALYPIIGKLIGRYLRAEIERISQQIDERLKDPFSFESLKMRFKALFSGVSYEELLLQSTANPQVEELFVVHAETGLLLGNFSLNQLIHPDMVAGMLTGIKSFIEHAFERESQELHTMEYEQNEILLFSFQNFYIAAVVQGQATATFKQALQRHINLFCEHNQLVPEGDITQTFQTELSSKLNDHFHGFNEKNQ